MKHFLRFQIFLLLALCVSTNQGWAQAKTYRVTAEQQLNNGKLQIDLYIQKISGADFVLAASNFSLFVSAPNLDLNNVTVDNSVDGIWDLQSFPAHYWNVSAGAVSNYVSLNITSKTDAFSQPNAKVTAAQQRIGRLLIPITNPNGNNELAWNLVPIQIHDWSRNRIKPLGEFVFANPNIPLRPADPFPIELLSFDAKWTDNRYLQAAVTWTAYNKPSDISYELERSPDGANWKKIDQQTAQNAAGGLGQYQYLDNEVSVLNHSRFYYRLKLNEADGKTSYSNMIELTKPEDGSLFTVYPNPVQSGQNLEIRFTQNSLLTLEVFDAKGAKVFEADEKKLKDRVSLSIPTTLWAAGSYYVSANTTQRTENLKIMVIR